MFFRSKPTQRVHSRKRRKLRSGVVTVEFALCLPVLALICFGSIQLGGSVLLRHKTVSILEIGTLDFMLGNVAESDLQEHIQDIVTEFNLVGGSVTVTPENMNNADFLRVELSLPINDNLMSPMYVGGLSDLTTEVLIYKP